MAKQNLTEDQMEQDPSGMEAPLKFKSIKRLCKNCDFLGTNKKKMNLCRFDTPQPHIATAGGQPWSPVEDIETDWCSKFEPKN